METRLTSVKRNWEDDLMADELRHATVVLFEGFELLDVFGPVELFSRVPELLSTDLIGPGAGPVTSSQGTAVIAAQGYEDAVIPDIALIPGGQGTRQLVSDAQFLEWLHEWARPARLIASVCTGSAVLAAALIGKLYGRTVAQQAAVDTELEIHEDPSWDPFAQSHGLSGKHAPDTP